MRKVVGVVGLGLVCALQGAQVGVQADPPVKGEGWLIRARSLRLDTPPQGGHSALAFDAARDQLILVQGGEPDEFGEIRGRALTRRGEPAGDFRLEVYAEPSSVALGADSGDLFLLDGDELVRQRRRGAASEPGDWERSSLGFLNLGQPRGVALDPASGSLFALDGDGAAMLRVDPDHSPGREGIGKGRVSRIELGAGITDPRGIAFNPEDSRLYVLSPKQRRVHEITLSGQVATSHDLSRLRVSNPVGLAIAPSGDPTDDPERQSLYVLDSGGPSAAAGEDAPQPRDYVVEIYRLDDEQIAAITTVQQAVPTFQSALVRRTLTSQWSPPSPDPSGIAYMPAIGRLIVADGEVEETSRFAGKNVWEATVSGSVRATSVTTAYSDEPVGVAFNPANKHLFISDDDARRIFEIDPRGDGLFNTSDDVRTSFSTTAFGSDDPEGLAFSSLSGYLYVADGVGREVYEIRPGPNGRFNGVPPSGDDVVSHFDVMSMGLTDPEGIEHNPDTNTLYVGDDVVLEMTTSGVLVRTIDISASGGTSHGLASGPSSVNPSQRSLFMVDRGVDNDGQPSENDGKLYEMTLPAPPPPPNQTMADIRVSAGADDAEEKTTGSMSLTSGDLDMMLDDSTQQRMIGMRFNGLPVPRNARIVSSWIQFRSDEATSVATTLTINGQAADNAAAFTTATNNLSARAKTTSAISWSPPTWAAVGLSGPEQRTPDLSPIIQQIVNRGGWSAGNSMALFITGSGCRVVDSFEGGASAAPLLHVQYEAAGSSNLPPVANAGPDQSVQLASGAILNGSVSDDGKPDPPGVVTTQWTKAGGPGTVAFSNSGVLNPTVTFSAAGIYTLRLTANDSALTHSDDVIINVVGAGTALTVDVRVAGPLDDAEDELDGDVDIDSSDLDMQLDGTTLQRSTALRFNGVGIPKDATIVGAYIQFKADEATADPTILTIRGEASDNAAPFVVVRGNISSRQTTLASATWSPVAWGLVGEIGLPQRTADLGPIIREIVSRPGWTGGNSIVIIITGSGRRVAESYEGSATGAALLRVEYRTGS